MSLIDTWKCHICSEERPDDKISVMTKPLVINGQVCGEQNIRYCNDRPACIEGAKEFNFSRRGVMELQRAKAIASEVIKRLGPYCSKIEVAGSVRRLKPIVKDIDFVLIPSDPWNLAHEVTGLGPVILMGEKLKRVNYNGVQVDLYHASEETWATLLLIRTGSKGNNIRLCTLAKKRGWHLAASGDGLFNQDGQRIAGDSEESIYEALDLPYQPPVER